jgi:EmrB/QacA subfamily drug resistance transporter
MANRQKRIGFVVAGLMLGILMASMDNTIVATAMATIVGDLGGYDQFVWVTSAYLVTEMAGMPIFGKLSDMYGRKRFFIFGLIFFILGSILCGTAQSIVQLSIYRAIQGIGGGALIPIAFTIVFDIFPPEKRGSMAGLFGAVFGLSSIFGPLLGAYITDYINWHWIFYINLPLGILALLFVFFFYKESVGHSKQKIDWWGALTLVGAIISLMFALELGGNKYDWNSGIIIGLFAIFAILFLVFLFIERRAAEPIISFQMFKTRLFAASNLVGFFYGAGFIVASIYIPIFVQGVMGGTATNSGLILLPMMLGTVAAAQIGGFLATKMNYRNIMIIFALIFVSGILLLSTLDLETSRTMLTFYMIITGLGIGASFSVLGMASIHHFDETKRGSANSTLAFIRSLGMTVGITIYGVIQRNLMSNQLEDIFAGMGPSPFESSHLDPRVMLSQAERNNIPAEILEQIREALSSSIARTFMWALIPALLAFAFVFLMSKERLLIPDRAHKKEKSLN